MDTAKAVVKAAIEDEKSKGLAMRAFLLAVIEYVRAAFGNSPDVLVEFGLAPKKARKPLTAEQLAAAKAKRDATRKARGTRGRKAKLAVKGDVTGVVVTPVTASPSAPQPAPTASSASGGPTNGAHS